MELDGMVAQVPLEPRGAPGADAAAQPHPYPTRQNGSLDGRDPGPLASSGASAPHAPPKETVFKLVVSEDQGQYARLPLRIRVNQRDDAQSIIDTVKAFFGLPDSMGVTFEDSHGQKLVPQYDNFVAPTQDAGEFIVRVILDPQPVQPLAPAADIKMPTPEAPQLEPAARLESGGFDMSPRRLADVDHFSDAGSVTSSRRDNLASAEISVENIVEGGRRKWTKFESSALPLFNPPQIPVSASLSSVSPQRRLTNTNMPSPLPGNQYTFSYSHALPSPMSYNASEKSAAASYVPQHGYGGAQSTRSRGRTSGGMMTPRLSANSAGGLMPTPAPTISSAMSDEDVALQLIRLGDPSNLSLGRTSTTTADDALSGKADAASSEEDDEEDDGHMHALKRSSSMVLGGKAKKRKLPKLQTDMGGIGDMYSDADEQSELYDDGTGRLKSKAGSKGRSGSGAARPKAGGKAKARQMSGAPGTPFLHSGRESVASSVGSPAAMGGGGDDDLSMLPRCQRCRKSKKGCDRQRPCGRCRDAGIGIDGCISEDEGNGRKGRFGRHMGVPVGNGPLDEAGAGPLEHMHAYAELVPAAASAASADANGKKRKK